MTSIPESDWTVMQLRNTTRGKLKVSTWHHHMALVMMAMVFMLSEKIKHEDDYPLLFLSCADIEKLLAHFSSKTRLYSK